MPEEKLPAAKIVLQLTETPGQVIPIVYIGEKEVYRHTSPVNRSEAERIAREKFDAKKVSGVTIDERGV